MALVPAYTDVQKRTAIACFRRYGVRTWRDEWLKFFERAPDSKTVRTWAHDAEFEPQRAEITFWERVDEMGRVQMLTQVGQRVETTLDIYDRYLNEAKEELRDPLSTPQTANIRAQSLQRLATAVEKLVGGALPRGAGAAAVTLNPQAGSNVQLLIVAPTSTGRFWPIDPETQVLMDQRDAVDVVDVSTTEDP